METAWITVTYLVNLGLILLISLLSLFSCGVDPTKAQQKNDPEIVSTGTFVLQGSASPAFSVEVDGKQYDDMEQYFNYESGSLPDIIKQMGYPNYIATFEAEIGFKDLYNNMTVYISDIEQRGYQKNTQMQLDGTFKVTLDSNASGRTYRIRANKRISIKLLARDDSVTPKSLTFCYNFSATDMSVVYTNDDYPIILSNFSTSITTYKCTAETETSTIPIPKNTEVQTSNDQTFRANMMSSSLTGYETVRLIVNEKSNGNEVIFYYFNYDSGYCKNQTSGFFGTSCYIASAVLPNTDIRANIGYYNINDKNLSPYDVWPNLSVYGIDLDALNKLIIAGKGLLF